MELISFDELFINMKAALEVPEDDNSEDARIRRCLTAIVDYYVYSICNRELNDIPRPLGSLLVEAACDRFSNLYETPQQGVVTSVQQFDSKITYATTSSGEMKYSGDSYFKNKGFDAILFSYRKPYRPLKV